MRKRFLPRVDVGENSLPREKIVTDDFFIVYYVISPVHVHNVGLLAPEFGAAAVRLAYDAESPWLNERYFDDISFEAFAIRAGNIPPGLWGGGVGAVVFSTTQPRPEPMALLQEALERGVPTIAIEESNQIALNRGTINNYVLPVDHVLTASEHERRNMVAAGFPDRRFSVSGWPFYGGRVGKVDDGKKYRKKEELGLDPHRPVAALTLTGLYDAGESPEVRRRQLTMSARGLPDDYQLVVKPHPIEQRKTLMPFINECSPSAKVVEGKVRIEELLGASDVILNRGVSQVCIEALYQEIPVAILDTGIETPFHGIVDDLIAVDEGALREIVLRLAGEDDAMTAYKLFFLEHMPYAPGQAKSLTCRRITEIARTGERDPDLGKQYFELALYQAWAGLHSAALYLASHAEVASSGCPAESMSRLIERRASRADLDRLMAHIGSGFLSHLLRSLWIDQLIETKTVPTQDDLTWLETFPPRIHPIWFVKRARSWALCLVEQGHVEEARDYAERVCGQFIHVPGVAQLKQDVDTYSSGRFGKAKLAARDAVIPILASLRNQVRRWR
jgi:hypothetical protein